jgi:hypothetical protein
MRSLTRETNDPTLVHDERTKRFDVNLAKFPVSLFRVHADSGLRMKRSRLRSSGGHIAKKAKKTVKKAKKKRK